MRPLYLCFSQDMDPERAKELYRHHFGTEPQSVFIEQGLLKAGPCPERVTQPEESVKWQAS